MSSLVPSLAVQNSVASAAQAAVRRIEPAVASFSNDGRDGAQARDSAAARQRPRGQTILPPERVEESRQGQRRTRNSDMPSYWPTAAYFVQHLSQEALPDEAPRVDHGTGTAHYPSLAFDSDIILPGDAVPTPQQQNTRIDIIV